MFFFFFSHIWLKQVFVSVTAPSVHSYPKPSQGLSNSLVENLLFHALKAWSDAAPLNFQQLQGDSRGATAEGDIKVSFSRLLHDDGYPFDGLGGTLAHAFYPGVAQVSGDTHFDDDESWSFGGISKVADCGLCCYRCTVLVRVQKHLNVQWRLHFQWYFVWPSNTFASHFHRWQQHHRLVHSRRARVWPRAWPVAFVLWSVYHEAILPGLCGGRFHVQTGPGWQTGYPAAVWSVFVTCVFADTTTPSGIIPFFLWLNKTTADK